MLTASSVAPPRMKSPYSPDPGLTVGTVAPMFSAGAAAPGKARADHWRYCRGTTIAPRGAGGLGRSIASNTRHDRHVSHTGRARRSAGSRQSSPRRARRPIGAGGVDRGGKRRNDRRRGGCIALQIFEPFVRRSRPIRQRCGCVRRRRIGHLKRRPLAVAALPDFVQPCGRRRGDLTWRGKITRLRIASAPERPPLFRLHKSSSSLERGSSHSPQPRSYRNLPVTPVTW